MVAQEDQVTKTKLNLTIDLSLYAHIKQTETTKDMWLKWK